MEECHLGLSQRWWSPASACLFLKDRLAGGVGRDVLTSFSLDGGVINNESNKTQTTSKITNNFV